MTEPARSPSGTAPGPSRRQVLAALLFAPAGLVGVAGCAPAVSDEPAVPDPLIPLAERARADAALAAAVIAARPAAADGLDQVRRARMEHAAALDAEIARRTPSRTGAPATSSSPARPSATVARLQEAMRTAGRDAAEVALGLPADRVGLVASVAACCSTYAAVLK